MELPSAWEHEGLRGLEGRVALVVAQVQLKTQLLLSGRVATDPSLNQMRDRSSVSYIVEVHIRKVAIALSTHTSLWW